MSGLWINILPRVSLNRAYCCIMINFDCREVRKAFPKEKPVGVQILAGANQGALAVALAAG